MAFVDIQRRLAGSCSGPSKLTSNENTQQKTIYLSAFP